MSKKETRQRVILDQNLSREYHFPIFEVRSAGKTVEWSDRRGQAYAAYSFADTLPKQLIIIHEGGRRIVLRETNAHGQEVEYEQGYDA